MNQKEKELLTFIAEKHGIDFVKRLKYYFDLHFGAFDIRNRAILEIGAGNGYLSALCLMRGASKVIALEPESEGSIKGVNHDFATLLKHVKIDGAMEYLTIDLDNFLATRPKQTFDYILMCNVINHIYENAVTKLHLSESEKERNLYIKTFEKLYGLLNYNGTLLVSDSGRYNLWNSMGMRFPACPTIDWNKHQDPDVWNILISKARFTSLTIDWLPLYKLRHLRAIVSRKIVAQCLNSYFLITAKKFGSKVNDVL